VIIGNPPFHGDRHLLRILGDDYVEWLRREFGVGIKDLCVYWFRKGRATDLVPYCLSAPSRLGHQLRRLQARRLLNGSASCSGVEDDRVVEAGAGRLRVKIDFDVAGWAVPGGLEWGSAR